MEAPAPRRCQREACPGNAALVPAPAAAGLTNSTRNVSRGALYTGPERWRIVSSRAWHSSARIPATTGTCVPRKALLVLITVLILPVAAVWGRCISRWVRQSGCAAHAVRRPARCNGGLLAHARLPWLLQVGQLGILLAPTLSMVPLGGFLASAGVGLWGILAPLGALVFTGIRSAVRSLHRVPRWRPRSRDHRRAHRPYLAAAASWFTSTILALKSRSAGRSCLRCSRFSPASAATRSRRSGRNRQRPKTSCSTSCRARSPRGCRPRPSRSRTSSGRPRSCSPT